jgi:hypothetical protein
MQDTNGIDRELVGHALDLGRPELKPIRDRYATRNVLVVEGRSDSTLFRDAFLAAGWRVHTCAGPGRTKCPVLSGKDCAIRESADVAVVYVDVARMAAAGATIPRVRCAADGASPGIVALEGRTSAPQSIGRQAVVGALAEPQRIVELAESLWQGFMQ